MTNFKHLNEIQISAYHTDSLEKTERHDIGRHLLNCAECRKLLPLPSIERFWSAIMTEPEIEDEPAKEETESSSIWTFPTFALFLKSPSGLVWGSAALVILLSFSFLLWLNAGKSESQIVQTFDNELEQGLNFPLPVKSPKDENSASSTNANRAVISRTPKPIKSDVPKPKISQSNLGENLIKPNLRQPKENISATRGGSANCTEEKNIELEFSSDKENLVFKWKKVPNAAKYHLYISDDEEILIDEFETENETSFVLRKPLNPLKTYQWKIIITLENGQTVLGPSSKFTVKDFQIKPEKKKDTNIRCSVNG